MYKDYKKTESLDTGLVGGSGIIWMFSGIILGLLVGIGMYFVSNRDAPMVTRIDTVQNKIVNIQSTETQQQSKQREKQLATDHVQRIKPAIENKTEFTYYAVLPNLGVPVNTAKPIETRVEVIAQNKEEFETVATQELVKEVKTARKQGKYLLQVASFKRKKMATLTRGRLAKKGVEAYIKKRKVKGRMWYRVVAGPVDQGNIDNWKQTAEKLGHRPLVISVR